MAFKIVATVMAFIGITSAYVVPLVLIPQPSIPQPAPLNIIQEPKPLPQYTFTYGVHDSISGDSKSASESRNGDVVKGEYSLNDADGFKRTVTYTADAANGFQAVVDRKPIANDVTADIEALLGVKSVAPIAAPLVINNLTPINNTLSPIIQGAPLIHYKQGPQLINSIPLTYSSPVVFNSFPRGRNVDRSVFKPIPNVTYTPSPLVSVAHVASSPYIVFNSSPVA